MRDFLPGEREREKRERGGKSELKEMRVRGGKVRRDRRRQRYKFMD